MTSKARECGGPESEGTLHRNNSESPYSREARRTWYAITKREDFISVIEGM